ncbi:cytochrome C [Rhodohalobacter sp. SW132]|uniref:c-type cytochrome n=1 Tax=Rhodohalobacter sp. SW132 TaxID=2293433 RepID=UPI000E2510C0|nr:cytochrome C [Rhodohalobacter sp. SW132]REL33237.1 cytochrome C [Rhodohalobacter sp. SW132]
MKKPIRYSIYSLAFIPILIVVVIGYVKLVLPDVGPAPEIRVEITDEIVDHGRYLANHVMLCMDCHAVRDFSLFAGPLKPGTKGAGGEVFDRDNLGVPGSFVAPNLTPAALGDWTDGEIFRAITSGVSKDGSALFPIMPYPNYSQLAEEDVHAIIAYLRTLEPVEYERPPSEYDFPVNFLINTMPVKPNLQPKPEKEDVNNYGRYLVNAAACADCHTRIEKGSFVGEMLAGGNEFKLPDGSVVRSANITPHETGIGNWTKEQFVTRFKVYADSTYVPRRVEPGQFQTMMPWLMYADMESEDLEAIYEYLRTIEPADNRITIFSPSD